jgi:CRP-like cAMP-binding protein
MKVTADFIKKLSKYPLFENASAGVIKLALSADDCEIKTFNSGEIMFGPETNAGYLALILRGKGEVFSADPVRDVLINTVSVGDTFGSEKLFEKGRSLSTRVVSKGGTRVLFISEASLCQMIENDKTIMYNYIRLVSDRVRMLNEKTMYFTAGSTERRLALYLTSLGKKTIRMTISMTDLANTLDVGRASLYRAFDKLSDDGYIIRSEKVVLILDREELLKHYN